MNKICSTLVFLVAVISEAFGQRTDTIFMPAKLPYVDFFTLHKFSPSGITVSDQQMTNIFQFGLQDTIARVSFQFTEKMHRAIYTKFFSDSTKYDVVRNYLRIEGDNSMLCNIESIHVDDGNNIYAIVQGKDIIANPRGQGSDNMAVIPFFTLVEITDHKIRNMHPIDSIGINNEYFLIGHCSFFKRNNDFYFTLIKDKVLPKGNHFLGRWSVSANGRLKHQEILPIELPGFYLTSKVNYGLLDFFVRENYLMFWACNTLIDINTRTEKDLAIPNMQQFKMPQIQYGESFNSPFSLCDFYVDEKGISLLVRKHKTFFKLSYSAPDLSLLQETRLAFLDMDMLGAYPLFAGSADKMLIYPRGERYLLIRNE